jgi:hypothetical protein
VAIKTLNSCSVAETKASLENWYMSDLLTEDELGALYQYFGWERPA